MARQGELFAFGPQAPKIDRSYEDVKAAAAARSHRKSLEGRDIGDIPPVENPQRKESCRGDLKTFLRTYFPEVFYLDWSPTHLEVIKSIETAATRGGQFALAMPRGYGKTQLCIHAAIWAAVYGYRQFIVVIAAEDNASHDIMVQIKRAFERNEALAADFPEICYPAAALEGIVNRAKGQVCHGVSTNIEWNDQRLVFPTVPGAAAAGTVITSTTLTGRLRGFNYDHPSGRKIRPDFALIDDPQTRESAKSLKQVTDRLNLINSDVLGMAGPQVKITAIMPCTVIYPNDLADQMLNREVYPEWQGVRHGILNGFPEDMLLWQRYWEIRSHGMRTGKGVGESNDFYVLNRSQMDKGCSALWPANFRPDEVSGIQFAMDIYLADKQRFFSEYQNEPMALDYGDGQRLTDEMVYSRMDGRQRGTVPQGVTKLTMSVDVQQNVLFYAILGTSQDFSSWLVDYGVYPEQPLDVFTAKEAAPTYGDVYMNCGGESALMRALADCILPKLERDYEREDGATLRISRCLVDSGWSTQPVYEFVKTCGQRGIILPSKGVGISATGQPISERKRAIGEVVSGYEWRLSPLKANRQTRVLFFDSNYWKSFLKNRMGTSIGESGGLRLCGSFKNGRDKLLADHLTAEYSVLDISQSRRVDVWKLIPGRENHWLDCIVGCLVAASEQGAQLLVNPPNASGREAKPIASGLGSYKPGKRTLSELQSASGAGQRLQQARKVYHTGKVYR